MNNPLKYTDPSGYQYFRNYDELPFMDSGAGYAAGSAFYRADMISNHGYSAATAMMPHWSVSTRNPGTNFAYMNQRTYDGIYGKGAYDVYYDDFYVSKEVDISTTGNVAEKDFGTVLAWMNMTLNEKDWQLTIIEAFGNTTIIGSFNDPGTIRLGVGGGLIFSNPTAGALAGEAQVSGKDPVAFKHVSMRESALAVTAISFYNTLKSSLLNWGRSIGNHVNAGSRYFKFVNRFGVIGSFAGLSISGYNIYSAYNTGGFSAVSNWDIADFTVGAAGLATTGLVTVGLVSNPVGWMILGGTTVYFGARFAYELSTKP